MFESRFESGNLARAIRVTDTYYELRLRPDLYTSRHCQWFYFRVQNMKAEVTNCSINCSALPRLFRVQVEYRFSFVNFGKPDSQYSVGMKPVLYSELEASKSGTGWMRAGTDMTYFKVYF